MKNPLSSVKQLLTELTFSQKKEILEMLSDEQLTEEILGLSDTRPDSCRCCGSTKFIRNGKETISKRQRYLCRDCNRSFTSMTGTVLDNMHKKEEFIRYVRSFIENHSLRKAAATHEITLNTSFKWRHKLLHALGLSAKNLKLDGEIKADEKYFPFPAKGSPM